MNQRTFKLGLMLSLLIHLGMVLSSFVLPKLFPPKSEKIELSYLSSEDLKKLSELQKKPDVTKQIVEQSDKALNDELDPQAKFLSAHNQVVKKQTVSENHGEFKNRSQKQTQVASDAKKKSVQNQDKPSDLKAIQELAKKDLQKFMPQMNYEKMVADKMEQEKVFDQTRNSAAAANPAQQQNSFASQASQASQTNDYLKDVDKGNETLLSTREFVYYTFYNRIRQQLNQYWGGKVREKLADMFKQGRSIASTDDRITKLLIVLDRKGILVKVQVLSNSGVRDLDEAAIDAFRAAAPFPNPPKGIVDADGMIKIRWDFILEASRSNLFATDIFWC